MTRSPDSKPRVLSSPSLLPSLGVGMEGASVPSKRVLGLLDSETPGWVVTSVPSVSLNSYLWPTLCRHLWSLAPRDLPVCQVRAPGGPGRVGVGGPLLGCWMRQDLVPPAHLALRPHEFPGDLTLGGSGLSDHPLAAHNVDWAPEGMFLSHIP